MSEWKERTRSALLESAVADEHSLAVLDAVGARCGVIVCARWIVFPATLERCRQMARRIHIAEEDLGQRGSSFLTGIPRFNDSRNAIDPLTHVHAATRRHHHYAVRSRGDNRTNQLVLTRRQRKGAVPPLALTLWVEADGENDRVRLCCERHSGLIDPAVFRHDSHSNEWAAEACDTAMLEHHLVWSRVEDDAGRLDRGFRQLP